MNFFIIICLVKVLVIVEFCLEVSNVIVNNVERRFDFVMVIKILLFNVFGFDKVLYNLKNDGFFIVFVLKIVIFIMSNKELIKKVRVN